MKTIRTAYAPLASWFRLTSLPIFFALLTGSINVADNATSADDLKVQKEWLVSERVVQNIKQSDVTLRRQHVPPVVASKFDPAIGIVFEDALPAGPTPRVARISHGGEYRLPGEFEFQRALMVSCQAILCSDGVCEAIRAVEGRVIIVALYDDEETRDLVAELLAVRQIRLDAVRFYYVRHNTMWTRDYGPVALIGKRRGQIVVIDTNYVEEDREDDDLVPLAIAQSAGLPVVSTELIVEGGNLISNGNGLVICSSLVLKNNPKLSPQTVTAVLQKKYGATEVVFLEPLENEPTGHVDMFATFTSPNCVVVGQYDPQDDEINASILNHNARRLAAVHAVQGPLKVYRIPMPSHQDGLWRTYTNVVYANGTLLVPTYSQTRPSWQHKALSTYRQLLPAWKVISIDSDDLISTGGALHCVFMNLGPLSAERIGSKPIERPAPRVVLQR